MLKIFLVEDEFVVREGIKNIDWASHGYEFCGEASDGELALPQIEKLQPDVVITDIKMPFMDGIELSRHIKKNYPQIEIVILSGYEEFGYAKDAIEIGVARYLTKPIGAAELLAEVDALGELIESRRREREISEQYKKDMEEDEHNSRNQLFKDIVSGTKSVSEMLNSAESLGIELKGTVYRVVLGIVFGIGNDLDAYDRTLISVYHEVQELYDRFGFVLFDRDVEGQALLFMADDESKLNKNVSECLAEFENLSKKYEGLDYYFGVGTNVFRLSEISVSFDSARAAFAHRFFDHKTKIAYSDSQIKKSYTEPEELDISSIDTKSLDRGRLIEFLKMGENSEIEYFLNEFFEDCGDSAIKSNMFRQYIAMDMYFAVSGFVGNLGLDKSSLEPVDSSLSIAQDAEKLREYCTRIITEAIALRDSVSHNKYKIVVDSAIGYIEENYTDEDLSLNMLAEYVRFSPNHLSMIFSQQTGMTFSKYLIEYRINKAKEMLRCTSKKSSEIAVEIGYKDPHYFSYMFKKTTGMTPTQYRDGKADE